MVLVVAFYSTLSHKFLKQIETMLYHILPERIYNPITAMGFSAMLTFQLDNTKRKTLPEPHCRNGSCSYVQAVVLCNLVMIEINAKMPLKVFLKTATCFCFVCN